MKLAEDWASYFPSLDELQDKRNIVTIRKIQAEALRYAANMSGEEATMVLLALADKLDPPIHELSHPDPV